MLSGSIPEHRADPIAWQIDTQGVPLYQLGVTQCEQLSVCSIASLTTTPQGCCCHPAPGLSVPTGMRFKHRRHLHLIQGFGSGLGLHNCSQHHSRCSCKSVLSGGRCQQTAVGFRWKCQPAVGRTGSSLRSAVTLSTPFSTNPRWIWIFNSHHPLCFPHCRAVSLTPCFVFLRL